MLLPEYHPLKMSCYNCGQEFCIKVYSPDYLNPMRTVIPPPPNDLVIVTKVNRTYKKDDQVKSSPELKNVYMHANKTQFTQFSCLDSRVPVPSEYVMIDIKCLNTLKPEHKAHIIHSLNYIHLVHYIV